MERCLQEFRIRGVKTNIPFLISLITHPTFLAGEATTRMIDKTPELFELPKRKDRATKILRFLATGSSMGDRSLMAASKTVVKDPAPIPSLPLLRLAKAEAQLGKPALRLHRLAGFRNRFLELGSRKVCSVDPKQQRVANYRHDDA